MFDIGGGYRWDRATLFGIGGGYRGFLDFLEHLLLGRADKQ